MDLIIIGQPTVTRLTINDVFQAETQGGRRDTLAFRLTPSEDNLVQDGIQVGLLYEPDEEGQTVEQNITIGSIPASRRRRAKKRGWARLRISPRETTTLDIGMVGYLLFVSSS
jgi:hypothetical protein